jgi:hypothetical protein
VSLPPAEIRGTRAAGLAHCDYEYIPDTRYQYTHTYIRPSPDFIVHPAAASAGPSRTGGSTPQTWSASHLKNALSRGAGGNWLAEVRATRQRQISGTLYREHACTPQPPAPEPSSTRTYSRCLGHRNRQEWGDDVLPMPSNMRCWWGTQIIIVSLLVRSHLLGLAPHVTQPVHRAPPDSCFVSLFHVRSTWFCCLVSFPRSSEHAVAMWGIDCGVARAWVPAVALVLRQAGGGLRSVQISAEG